MRKNKFKCPASKTCEGVIVAREQGLFTVCKQFCLKKDIRLLAICRC
jgi:hypothetical protein